MTTPRAPNRIPHLAGALLALCLALPAPAVRADSLDSSATDIIRALAPTGPSMSAPGSPRKPAGGTGDRLPVHGPGGETVVVLVDRSRALDFDVFFPFDSAELTPQARRSLANLGAALAAPELAGHAYLIAGHTDARGSAAHNDDLSYRRALAVRRYLVESFPIAPERLFVAGFGARFLRAPDAPAAAVNRRVEVALVLP